MLKMEKLKVMTIFGTRPEAIKMAPLVKELENRTNISSIVCVTAQHREMLDQVMKAFDIKADYDLNIMKDKQTLTGITTNILSALDGLIKESEPDIVLVHGDTTTTMAASLAAFYQRVKVGHVEAGLRTYDKYSPYPEELNRQITGRIADLHFAPTKQSLNNLKVEGVDLEKIYITGNTVIDAMNETVEDEFVFNTQSLNQVDFNSKKIIMVTAHRRENLGEPLENICKALKQIAIENDKVEIIYLVHMNPLVKDTVNKILGGIENVKLLPPLEIKETHNLISRCYMVVTDSGGLQEEAPHLGKPVLVLRDTTERPEAIKAGTAKLVGTVQDNIYKEISRLLNNKAYYTNMSNAINPYGDGHASKRIVDAILYEFGLTKDRPLEFISYDDKV
jgi:UDP-N-acetylglucosamine 2-epimerase (non-hydrolysing)